MLPYDQHVTSLARALVEDVAAGRPGDPRALALAVVQEERVQLADRVLAGGVHARMAALGLADLVLKKAEPAAGSADLGQVAAS